MLSMDQAIDTESTRSRPTITVTAADYSRLSALARAAMNSMPDLAAGLADELERADVLPNGRHPEHVVCMGSQVRFRDETTGKVHDVMLVYPEEADISVGRVSVLTPVGTALLGLSEGHSIDWETPSGQCRALTVIAVGVPR